MTYLKSLLLILTISIFAVPPTLHYQGRLTNAAGVGENATYDMEFRIYDVESGGVALWTQTITDVEVSKGLFDAELSDIDIPFDGQYWMEIVVDDDVMSPRVKLASSAYAFRAEIADSIAGGDLVIATRDTMIAHWDSIRGIPEDIADGDDGLTEVDWDTDIVNIPPGFDDDIDDVIATRDTMIAHWDSLRNIPEGFADGIDNVGAEDGDWTVADSVMYATTASRVGVGISSPSAKVHAVVHCDSVEELYSYESSFEEGTLGDFTTRGDADWTIISGVASHGTFSAKSGAIGDEEATYIELVVTTGNGTLSFDRKVSSAFGDMLSLRAYP